MCEVISSLDELFWCKDSLLEELGVLERAHELGSEIGGPLVELVLQIVSHCI